MSADITDDEQERIEEFLSKYFDRDHNQRLSSFDEEETEESSIDEAEEIKSVVDRTRNIYDERGKGYLGLALCFVLSVEDLSQEDPWLDEFNPGLDWEDDIQPRYEQKGIDYRTDQNIDTLTLRDNDQEVGIRGRINDIGDFFHQTMNRTNFPNAPGHYTGNWRDHIEILESAFSLSQSGRRESAERIIELGLDCLQSKDYPKREPAFSQPFLEILNNYERKHDNEMGGLAYQAMVYGYATAEWPHLSLRASSVRTGSSRQHRFGDIDGYHGPDLMISIEAKDRIIDEDDIDTELGTMMKLAERSTTISIAVCKEVEKEAREILQEEDVKVITDKDLTIQLRTWDYHKQNLALQGMVHFLEHIEENPTATRRLLRFVKNVDPNNSALAHLDGEDGSS
ncbi:hypothetical protein [Natronobacterium gregoryi]|uniref:Uncharacterized protein n=2 Tax=Natronobacterium gregoryi TaxID=44930 RepID=L0AC36_NATGS|nr:hypothetical protein [Natronobacterium gregoryi]AFZ71431.1 hypothetical protein Natgr_0167 [Natronobacterium gregoryi SP2]ELY66955.1 hypothetical protein C490_11983 [Natronobacterium gregoryi SP2]PLK21190.1 hypothetical protein CYV19_05065 [Natronobacterium gregoryi SP2]SFI84070.1 hypothetical protein SAMN05443661_1073 [Natronobacterium gregoryi]